MLFEIISRVLKWKMTVLSKILYFRTYRLKIKTEYSQSSDRLSVNSKGFDQYHNKPFSFDMLWFLLSAGRERQREREREGERNSCVCACVCSVHQYQCLPELGKLHSWFCVRRRVYKATWNISPHFVLNCRLMLIVLRTGFSSSKLRFFLIFWV